MIAVCTPEGRKLYDNLKHRKQRVKNKFQALSSSSDSASYDRLVSGLRLRISARHQVLHRYKLLSGGFKLKRPKRETAIQPGDRYLKTKDQDLTDLPNSVY